uniref:Cadherin domain-containing protein n=1 Tax=Timema poppense TaxID=170557 RepID=A0A7R9CTF0_TIMPO|nr:unnamed protein product [Timema poppensis]
MDRKGFVGERVVSGIGHAAGNARGPHLSLPVINARESGERAGGTSFDGSLTECEQWLPVTRLCWTSFHFAPSLLHVSSMCHTPPGDEMCDYESREGVVPGQVMMCGMASSFRMRDSSTFKVRLKAESYWQWILLVLLVGLCLEVAANRPPRFLINGQTEIVLRLKEGAETPVGSLIYRLHGADPDGDPLVFGVREQVGNDLLRIENLGTNEANVYLKQELDRESSSDADMTDGHLGEGNFITQSLLLLVEDVNDNEPVFKPYQPTIVVPENSPPGVLTTVEATDQDEGPYGQLGFSPVTKQLGFGSPISLGSALSPKRHASDRLALCYFRGSFQGIVLGSEYKYEEVKECVCPLGGMGYVKRATVNFPITTVLYFLQELDGDDDLFSVSTVNGKGVIRLAGQLDYERKFIYQLRVLAVDRANNNRVNTGTAAIVVKVQDVEDQPPEFVVASPVTRVSEDAAIGTPVLQVKAVDGDRGINNRIVYSITQGSQGSFEIDADSGVVFTQQKLDRESSTNNNGAYILEITPLEPERAHVDWSQPLEGRQDTKVLKHGV